VKNFKALFEKGDERDWQEIIAKENKERKYKKFKKRNMDFLDSYKRCNLRTFRKLREFRD
jgi:hypothetical protein